MKHCIFSPNCFNFPHQEGAGFQIEKVIFHESYGKPKAFQNDIALLKAGPAWLLPAVQQEFGLLYLRLQDAYRDSDITLKQTQRCTI
jgi:hypothetical protein